MTPEKTKQTEWFRKAEYGFFMHYLNSDFNEHEKNNSNRDVEAWNNRTDNFDVKTLAKQLHELGAGYLFITLGQNSGFYCSPNKEFDRLLGYTPETSKLSRRDLPLELAEALSEYDIPLMLYSTCLAPGFDANTIRALNCLPPWNPSATSGVYDTAGPSCGDPRLKEFLAHWEAIHREWSLRYGGKVKGWWIDGAYFKEKIYAFPDAPNLQSFTSALKAGNSEALVAFNPGVFYPPISYLETEEYTAGEINDPWYGVTDDRMFKNSQYHILTFAGKGWGTAPLRYSANELAAITKNIIAHHGVITWDIPFDRNNGTLSPHDMTAFREMRRILETDEAPPFSLSISPEKIVASSPMPFSLKNPHGEKITFADRTEYAFPDEFITEKTRGLVRLVADWGNYSRQIEIPLLTGQPIDWSKPFSAEIVEPCTDTVLAEIVAECDEDRLHVKADIFDAAPEVKPPPWDGSCLKLFLAGLNSEVPYQLIVTPDNKPHSFPPDAGTDGVVSSIIRNECRYTIEVDVPFARIPGFIQEQHSFKIEVEARVRTKEELYLNAQLFGAPMPFMNTDGYGIIQI